MEYPAVIKMDLYSFADSHKLKLRIERLHSFKFIAYFDMTTLKIYGVNNKLTEVTGIGDGCTIDSALSSLCDKIRGKVLCINWGDHIIPVPINIYHENNPKDSHFNNKNDVDTIYSPGV
jgi:hypothetical protein